MGPTLASASRAANYSSHRKYSYFTFFLLILYKESRKSPQLFASIIFISVSPTVFPNRHISPNDKQNDYISTTHPSFNCHRLSTILIQFDKKSTHPTTNGTNIFDYTSLTTSTLINRHHLNTNLIKFDEN